VWTGAVGKLNVKINAKITDMGVALHAGDSGYHIGRTDLLGSKREAFPVNRELAQLPLILDKLSRVSTPWTLVLHNILRNCVATTYSIYAVGEAPT
jgi:hypothetical protein